jgi:polar amino acid transport system permease protein
MTSLGWTQVLFLLQAAGWTAAISLLGIVGGVLIGLPVALACVSDSRVVRLVATAGIQLVQGTPLLVLMFLVYFGLSLTDLKLPALVATSLAMTIYAAAYLGEIWKGCIQAVPKAQWEAAECLGLSRGQRLVRVVLPQALRIATPPTVGFMVQIVKNSSLASVVGFVELAQAGKLVNNATFQPFASFGLVAAFYFAICYPMSIASRRLEIRLRAGRSAHVFANHEEDK